MRKVQRKTSLALLLSGLLASAACGTDAAPNVLITRIGEPGGSDAVLDCVATQLQPGDPPEHTLAHDGGVHVERVIRDGAVAVMVASNQEVLARRSYDAAFLANEQSDQFRVTANNRSFLLTFWAASNCAAPAPGEPGFVRERPPERMLP